MTIYTNFFCPQTIALLFCLNEGIQAKEEWSWNVEIKEKIMRFSVKTILKMSDASFIATSCTQFLQQIKQQIPQILEKYTSILTKIDSFNEFYKLVSTILKQLRSLHKSKLEQGNIVDFLIRRLYVYFEKLNFKEIIQIYSNFEKYLRHQPLSIPQHQFMLSKSIEQMKFNLQNYTDKPNPQLTTIVNELSKNDTTFKTSYLKGIMNAEQGTPIESSHEMHRYFDKCLGNLFQQKTEVSNMSNKINHCILSNAYTSLKMGHLEECLQAVSEGLRISQNNTDEQSINNCIIYLSKVAEQLGRYQEQILLTEHAINHALNLNNPFLTLYSCLIYSTLWQHHNCNTPSLSLLKNSHTGWTDALHIAHRKIHLYYESNCKNIYHSYRSLIIPMCTHKIAKLLHLPQLEPLLINEYVAMHEVKQLQMYKEYKGDTPVGRLIAKAHLHYSMGQQIMLAKSILSLQAHKGKCKLPVEVVQIDAFINMVAAQQEQSMYVVERVRGLIAYCNKYGFKKGYRSKQEILLCRILIRNGFYEDALVQLQHCIQHCWDHHDQLTCRLLAAQTHLQLKEFGEPLQTLMTIEENGLLNQTTIQNRHLFQETRLAVYREFMGIGLAEQEMNVIREKYRVSAESMFELSLQMMNMKKIISSLKLLQGQKANKAYEYCQKVDQVMREVDYETDDNEGIQRRTVRKIKMMME